jgi:hypothetical protein
VLVGRVFQTGIGTDTGPGAMAQKRIAVIILFEAQANTAEEIPFRIVIQGDIRPNYSNWNKISTK